MFKKMIHYAALLLFVSFATILAGGGIGDYDYSDHFEPSRTHPGGLSLDQVPVFIVIGFDDNGVTGLPGTAYDGGMEWLNSMFSSKKNPAGIGNDATFDDAVLRAAFYNLARCGMFVGNVGWHVDDYASVRQEWNTLYEDGYETGLHSTTHLMDDNYGVVDASDWSKSQWISEEIDPCYQLFVKEYNNEGVGIAGTDIWGWRTPFLHWAPNLLLALKDFGVVYDCSIEEGQDDDPTEYFWPYTLDNGSPQNPTAPHVEGLWELPVYTFAVPPELQAKAGKTKIQGLEYTVWYEEALATDDLYDILVYTLDKRIEGNRTPFTLGVHGDVYSNQQNNMFPNAGDHVGRQNALEGFIDYALTKPEVRFVRPLDLIEWMRNPVGLDGSTATIHTNKKTKQKSINIHGANTGILTLDGASADSYSVEIFSLNGRNKYSSRFVTGVNANKTINLPISEMPDGVFIATIKGADGFVTRKAIMKTSSR
jgi:hypothetical protein